MYKHRETHDRIQRFRSSCTKGLNIGCGDDYIDGLINCDLYHERADLRTDARSLGIEDATIDYIEANQVIEHIPIADTERTLLEWKRVLTPGGTIVISCPDIEQVLRLSDALKEAGPFRWRAICMYIYGSQQHEGQYHRAGFTPDYLSALMKNAGFQINDIIRQYPRRPTPSFTIIGEKPC